MDTITSVDVGKLWSESETERFDAPKFEERFTLPPVDLVSMIWEAATMSSADFVLSLAHHALEREAELCTDPIAKVQVAYLLRRLQKATVELSGEKKVFQD
jgi:hypothetical protein